LKKVQVTISVFKLFVSGLVLLLSNMAFASGTADVILNKWNAIVVNNLQNVAEIEGRTYVGGDMTISGSHQYGFKLTTNPVSDIVLAVNGNVTATEKEAVKVFYGSAAVTTQVSDVSVFGFHTSGGALFSPSAWPAANSPVSQITAASAYWQTLAANSTVSAPGDQPNPFKFNCAAGQSLAVFNITDVQSFENSKVQGFELNPDNATQTVIINVNVVDGNVNMLSGINLNGNFNQDKWRGRVIWNFYTSVNNGNLGTISLSTGFAGSIVAPSATLVSNSVIDGNVVVKNLNITSEVHTYPWLGSVPDVPSVCKNTVSGKVWHDANFNGTIDAGENGLQNITVQLIDNSNNVTSTVSDNAGSFSFSNVLNGTYTIKIADANFSVGGPFASTSDAIWYAYNSVTSQSVTLNCNDNTGLNFGFGKSGIKLTKSVSPATAKPGDKVTYSFTIQNTGDVKLQAGIDVFDALLNSVSPYKIHHFNDVVNAGGSVSFTQDYTVQNSDCGTLVNTATVKGYPVNNTDFISSVATATLTVDCSMQGVNNWNGVITPSASICEQDAKQVSVNGTVSITPNPSIAYLQTSWQLITPNDGNHDNSVHSSIKPFISDTSFTILGNWPGVSSTDTEVRLRFSFIVLDKDQKAIGQALTSDLYWNAVVCPPPAAKQSDVKIEKTTNNATPKNGDIVTYTIKVTNNGPDEAKGVQASDLLPSGLTYVSSNPSRGAYDATTGLWNIGNLANNESVTLTISVKVQFETVSNATYDLGPATGYNLFVLTDATQPSSDTEGKIAVGRDATFGNYSVGDKLAANSGDVLIVGRKLTYTSGRVYNGNVVYGESTNLPLSLVSIDGTLRKDSPINFAAAKTYLENLSSTLGAYTKTSDVAFQWGTLTLTGTNPYLNVFNVNGDDLSKANNVSISVPNGSGVLVNVNGKKVSWTGGLTVAGTTINAVLYNFYQAETITIQGIDVRGSVLAPLAAVNFASGVQNGQMICKSLTGIGQFNNSQFNGNVPVDKKIINTASIVALTTTDPNTANNVATAEISSVTDNGNGGNNGGGNSGSGSWQLVSSFAQNSIVLSMANDGANLYTGLLGGQILKSTDNGTSWKRINSDMNVGWIWSLCYSNNTLFAATESGIYKYDGSAWKLTNLTGKDVRSIISTGNQILAGTWGLGIYKSVDNGNTWTEFDNGLGNIKVVTTLSKDASNNIYAGVFGDGVYKLRAGETNWYKNECGNNFVQTIAYSNNSLYAGLYGDGLYKSTDAGSNWTKVTSVNVPFIYAILTDNTGKVFISSWSGGVYSSADGLNWSSLNSGISGVSSIVLSADGKKVYAGTKEGQFYAIDNTSSVNGVKENSSVPTEFKLKQNYPNPFNPSTVIEFSVAQQGKYSLKVYNMLGQEVASLIERDFQPGNYKYSFNANKLASGVYIYRLSGQNVNLVNKMILMK